MLGGRTLAVSWLGADQDASWRPLLDMDNEDSPEVFARRDEDEPEEEEEEDEDEEDEEEDEDFEDEDFEEEDLEDEDLDDEDFDDEDFDDLDDEDFEDLDDDEDLDKDEDEDEQAEAEEEVRVGLIVKAKGIPHRVEQAEQPVITIEQGDMLAGYHVQYVDRS